METKICQICLVEKSINEFSIYNKKTGRRLNQCGDCKKKYLRKYNEDTKEERYLKKKKYREKNSEILKIKKREYYFNNKSKIREYKKEWENRKRKNDNVFKLKQLIRHRLNVFLKTKKITKRNGTFQYVGCTPYELKEYLEKKFTEGMTWENHGEKGWHIDHIIPLSSAKDENDIYKLCHYTNLQPLWWDENMSKGNRF